MTQSPDNLLPNTPPRWDSDKPPFNTDLPSVPDTVEPTQSDYDLALKLRGHYKPHECPQDMWQESVKRFACLIRQHVAAEVARETAELEVWHALALESKAECERLRSYVGELEEQCDSIGLQKAQHAAGLTAHKSSPPPP